MAREFVGPLAEGSTYSIPVDPLRIIGEALAEQHTIVDLGIASLAQNPDIPPQQQATIDRLLQTRQACTDTINQMALAEHAEITLHPDGYDLVTTPATEKREHTKKPVRITGQLAAGLASAIKHSVRNAITPYMSAEIIARRNNSPSVIDAVNQIKAGRKKMAQLADSFEEADEIIATEHKVIVVVYKKHPDQKDATP